MELIFYPREKLYYQILLTSIHGILPEIGGELIIDSGVMTLVFDKSWIWEGVWILAFGVGKLKTDPSCTSARIAHRPRLDAILSETTDSARGLPDRYVTLIPAEAGSRRFYSTTTRPL